MRKPFFLYLFTLDLTVAAAFGAWRAGELWSGWPVWCLLLPPLAWWGLQALDWWRRGGPVEVLVVMGLVAFVLLSASGLGIAWVMADLMEESRLLRQFPPAVRALIGAALGVTVGGMTLLYVRSQQAVEPPQTSGSDSTVGPVEPDATPDRGSS
jgi:hypothetical protein